MYFYVGSGDASCERLPTKYDIPSHVSSPSTTTLVRAMLLTFKTFLSSNNAHHRTRSIENLREHRITTCLASTLHWSTFAYSPHLVIQRIRSQFFFNNIEPRYFKIQVTVLTSTQYRSSSTDASISEIVILLRTNAAGRLRSPCSPNRLSSFPSHTTSLQLKGIRIV